MSSCGLYQQVEFRAAAGVEFRPGGLHLTEELASLSRLQPGERVLDVGCGAGSTVSYLTHMTGVYAVGLDGCSVFLEEAGSRDARSTWVVGDASDLPFEEGSFDVVFCECVLSLIGDPAHALGGIRRVLRPGGRLAVSDMYLRNPEHEAALAGVPAASCLRGATGQETVISRVEEAGFTVTHWADRSDELKVLAARMVLAHGSVNSFWESVLGDAASRRPEIAASRPGYYLLAAEKRTFGGASPSSGRAG